MLDNYFRNVGKQIKSIAKFTYVFGLVLFFLAIIAGTILAITQQVVGYSILCFIAGFVIALANAALSTLIYGFGELVEDIHAMRSKYYPTEEESAKLEAEETAKRKAAEVAIREAAEAAKREAAEAAKREAAEKANYEALATMNEAEKEQLSKSDVEEAASKYLKRRVSLSDISCTLIYVVPKSTGIPKEMHLDMAVGTQEFTSLDLFFDENRHAYFFKGKHLALDGAWRSEEDIFGFDVTLFKCFNVEVDEDD